jgi:nucleoside-diphosphate-sugar epimerase
VVYSNVVLELIQFVSTSFHNQTILITGCAGFIGSHLVDALLESGARVYGVDNFLTGRQVNLEHLASNPNFTFIEADAAQSPSAYLPKLATLDLVLHFASPASPPQYQKYPVETYLINSLGTHNILQFLVEHHPQARFIFAGTSEAYGDPLEHPQTETYWGNVNPNGPRSCYDEAKRLGETICGVHHRDLGIDARIVRIFNTYGPRMNPSDGRVIPQFVTEALKGQPFSIQGDGQQTRSYCFVDDLVAGILAFASIDNLNGETINLGNPEEHTILETAQIVAELTGADPNHLNFKPLPKDDPIRRQPDISKAKALLDWAPRIPFDQGLPLTIEYFKQL